MRKPKDEERKAPLQLPEEEPSAREQVVWARERLLFGGEGTRLSEELLCYAETCGFADGFQGDGLHVFPPETAEMDAEALFETLWERGKRVDGDLNVRRGEVLRAGVYSVCGNVRLRGGTAGNVTILAAGHIFVDADGADYSPKEGGVLFLSRKGMILAGWNCKYRGLAGSLHGVLRVYGAWQKLEDSLCGRRIVLRGWHNRVSH